MSQKSSKRPLGRTELKPFPHLGRQGQETELNFKFCRQPTNKIAGFSDETASLLATFF